MQGFHLHAQRLLPMIFLLAPFAFGQARSQPVDGSNPGTSKQPDRRIMVENLSGGKIIGVLVGVRDDTLMVIAKGRPQGIPFDSLARVTLSRERRSGTIVPGMAVGAYAGFWLLRDESQPPVFTYGSEEFLFAAVILTPLVAAGTGSLTYLIRLVRGEEDYHFDFGQPGRLREAKLKQFNQVAAAARREQKAHISLHAGRIFTQVRDQYEGLLQDLDHESWYYQPSKVNLIRKAQLTYSVTRYLDIGVAYVSLSEPTIRREGHEEMYSEVVQSLEVPAYFAVVSHEIPNPGARRGNMHLGFCLGVADIDFGLEASRGGIYEDHVAIKGHVKATQFSSMMSCEWRFPLANRFSIGISADYAYTGPLDVPGLPDFDIPEQTLRLGNGSIGASLGFGF